MIDLKDSLTNTSFLMRNLEEVDCIICEEKTETSLVWADRERGDIVRCNRCDLVYRTPRCREDDQVRHFKEKWTEARPPHQLEGYRFGDLRRVVKWILKNHALTGAVLDIGSSYGALLMQFPQTWELCGIEPSKTASKFAMGRMPKATILNATLADAELRDKSFDVITMLDTIIYLSYPLRDLSRLPSLLRPGGIILIESQNFTNRRWLYTLMKHRFDATWLYFYTPATLEKLLHKAGMKVVDKFYVPAHQIGGDKLIMRVLALSEHVLLKAVKNITFNQVDLLPHFVLVAQPVIHDRNNDLVIKLPQVTHNIIDTFNQWVATKFTKHNVKMAIKVNCCANIKDVVKLHLNYLPTSFKKSHHMHDLLFYSYEITCKDLNSIFISIEADYVTVGYICIVGSHRSHYLKILKKYYFRPLVKALLVLLPFQRHIFKTISKRLMIILSGEYNRFNVSGSRSEDYSKIYEIRPMVVTKNFQGTGLARYLGFVC